MNLYSTAATVLVCVTIILGQESNESARFPTTPGYGISDYFELMPDKVGQHSGVFPGGNPRLAKVGTDAWFHRGTLRVRIGNINPGTIVKATIHDLNGRIILTLPETQSGSSFEFDNTRLIRYAPGAYLLRIIAGNHRWMWRLVMTR